MSVVTDENINLVAECESCSRCNLKFNASIRETASPYSNLYCSIWVEPTGNGGYTVTDYYWISGYCEIFSVPDNLSEYLSINSLRLSGRGYDLIRIPSGVQRLTANTNFTIGPKVLILPSSLTEIANGVFLDFSRLETIYYCGTEEQWNEVKLNGYRNAWKDVNVIFCPEGVSPEVAANSGY